jgi:cathepsin L
MLFTVIALSAFVALSAATPIGSNGELQLNASLNMEWTIYKERHGKNYANSDEEFQRRLTWESNLKVIDAHNALYTQGKKSYKLGANKFADMSNEEFRAEILMTRFDATTVPRQHSMGHIGENPMASAPASVDWRTKGYVTPIKDQGQCGSCWSFSATGSMEGQHFKATGKLVSLSEQNLMDCSTSYGNMGCNGGLMDQAFQYVIANKGVDTEMSYPYETKDDTCRFKSANVGATISSFKDIPQGDETSLTAAIASIGPISVAIDASQSSFQLYDGGVYDEPNCSSTQLDHGVLAVGYGTSSGSDYYLVKNSWGTSWGMTGYIMMSRNSNNQCGIATMASYPIV